READAIAQDLPGHDVGVMLQLSDEHLVAGFEESAAPAIDDEIDRLGRAAHEDDFAGIARVEEAPHGFARILIELARLGAQPINAAMYIGIIGAIELAHPIDHRGRLLRARCAVEEDEAGIVGKDRKVALDAARIERGRCPDSGGFHASSSSRSSQRRTCFARCACKTASSSICSIASAAKASISMRRASAGGMPRASK